MKVIQTVLRNQAGLTEALQPLCVGQPQLVLVFGSASWLHALAPQLAGLFGPAHLLGCTTAGEISSAGVTDDTCVVTAVHFDRVPLQAASTQLSGMDDSFSAGQRLATALPRLGLRAVLLLGQGVNTARIDWRHGGRARA